MHRLTTTLLTFLLAIGVTYLCYGKFLTLNANIGSMWINMNIYYIVAIGILVPGLFFLFNRRLRILYGIILILMLLYILLIAFDAIGNLAYQSLIVYFSLLLAIGFLVARFMRTRKRLIG